MFIWNFCYFGLCMLSFVLLLHTTEKILTHSLDTCPLDIYKCLNPIRQTFQVPNHFCSPPPNSLWKSPVFPQLRSPELVTVLQMWLHQGRIEEERKLPWAVDHALFNSARIPWAFLVRRACCWLMVNLLATRIPRSFSVELPSRRSLPNMRWCMWLFLPSSMTLHLPLLKFIRLKHSCNVLYLAMPSQ